MSNWFNRRNAKLPTIAFNDGCRHALQRARVHAVQLGASIVDTNHLLLALLEEPDGLIDALLYVARLDRRTLIDDLDRSWESPRDADAPESQLPFAAAVKQAIEEAMRLAQQFGLPSVGPGHLLMGVIRGGDVPARRLLRTGTTDQQFIEVIGTFGRTR